MSRKATRYLQWPIVLVTVFLCSVQQAKALPAPDFVFNVASSIAQFFGIAFIFLSAMSAAAYRFLRQRLVGRKRLVFWISVGAGILILSGGGAWIYGRYIQWDSMTRWSMGSIQNRQDASTATTAFVPESILDSSIDLIPASASSVHPGDTLDQLTFGLGTSSFMGARTSPDSVKSFIINYYQAIASHNFEDAYAMSKQSVPIETFEAWYKDVTDIRIAKMQRIDDVRTSLELTLFEGGVVTRYGVLMDVLIDAKTGSPIRVDRSIVRVLGQSASGVREQQPVQVESPAWAVLKITNKEFQAMLDSNQTDYLVLDAREDLEYEYGRFPGATHIRFADLKAGRWIELPTDRPVMVYCWSGLRGKEVAEFLRTKKIYARYIEEGASGWVAADGHWDGEVNFLSVYKEDRYRRVITLDGVKKSLAQGAVLVDTRAPSVYKKWHIPGSFNIPLMSTPSVNLEDVFAQTSASAQVITVCDDYISCFDAKLTGVELERRGRTFLGRFIEPWLLNTRSGI